MLWTTDKIMMIAFWGMLSLHIAAVWSFLGIISCFFSVSVVVWLVSAGTWLYLASLRISPSKRSVLITGCDSGFGNAIALHLDKLGFRVFAGCLFANAKGEGAEKLRKEGSDQLQVLQLDVTKQDHLDKALSEVKNILPEKEGLWGLINNAGLCTLGLVEWTPLEMFRKDSEVNYYGMVASTKTFMPLVRRAKGRIVNVTSMAGRITVPMMAGYCASKYAAEAFSDALRLEMKSWGVHVAVIEPGNYASGTELFKRNDKVKEEVEKLWDSLNDELKGDYGEKTCRKCENFMNSFRKSGRKDISPVLNAMTEALTQVHPQCRYKPQEPFMYFMTFLGTHPPEFVYDAIIRLLGYLSAKGEKRQ